MRFPRLPKFRLPKWIYNIKFPKLFQRADSPRAFYYVWKKFIRQIPPESRSTISSYQHFIVLGNAKSGKTDLIHGLIEQSQDLYPFDTSFTSDPDLQFYLGPNQVIQEISFSALEDRSIRIRKKMIRLWKKLYVRRDPIVIITYNCFSNERENLRDLNRLAQLISGKISLLSEITKKPLKVRVALTHLDKIPGYLEFARFLKQENLTFNINLSSDFESNTLEASLKKFFDEYITLMLTSTSNHDFSKILTFSKELPLHFHSIEEFLRALVARVSYASSIEIDKLSFTSNMESSTSFNPFQWTKLPSMQIFFRYPMLKHQLASACLFLLFTSILLHFYFQQRNELVLAKKGVDQLNLLQYNSFQEKVVPSYAALFNKNPASFLAYVTPNFFGVKLDNAKNKLADHIRKHYIEREFRKAALESKGELKCLYFHGLMHASRDNNLGRFILENSKKMADALGIQENLVKAYVNSCTENHDYSTALNLNKVNPFIPLTSFNPWLNFLKKIQEISAQTIFVEHNFEEIVKEAEKLFAAVNYLNNDSLPFAIATLLEEEYGSDKSSENIQVIRWVGDNIDALSSFLLFIKLTTTMPIDVEGMNIAQFFTKIKKMSALTSRENQTYNFALKDELFSFDTKPWTDLVVAHNVERGIQNYIVANNNSGGAIFFKNTTEAPEPLPPIFNGQFPYFITPVIIPGRYTRLEYENKVRSTAEKLAHLVDTLAVNPEEKKRFTTFLIHEVINYMKQSQECYTKYFDACDIKNGSMDSLKIVLEDLTHASSSFLDFLKFVQYQTGAFSEPVITLRNMRELNQFEFLNYILTQNEGVAPFAEYQKIMEQIVRDLDADLTMEDPEFHFVLKPYLTNTAKISSNILQNNSKSYVNKTKECLNSLGVPENHQLVFQKPILQLYKMGLGDLKRGVEQVWIMRFQSPIESVLSKFPFNPNGLEIASFDEIDKTLNPKGEFYRTVNDVMSTCLKKNDGTWRPLDAQNIQLSDSIYTTLNRIEGISTLLWDKEGNPQSINLSIKSVPFVQSPQENPVVVLSYLVLGDQYIRNLNQTPSWQNIKVDWWKGDSCTIGIELMNKYTNSKTYKSIQKSNSQWNFFELLREARGDDGNILTWKLASDNGEGETYNVSLCFERNPKSLLMPKHK